MVKGTFDSIVADFEKEAASDFIGLWQLIRAVKKILRRTKTKNYSR